jgi:hypothetical protein
MSSRTTRRFRELFQCSVQGIADSGLGTPPTGIVTMPSPFPGVNPYVEQDAFWQDFHLAFLPAIRGRLVAQVQPKYIVMLDEHLYVQELPPEPRRLVGRGDVSLAAAPQPRAEEAAGVGILEAPTQVHIPVQEVRRVPFLEVRDRLGRELITVLELLSPANKRGGADREQYVAKREQLLQSSAHFVEDAAWARSLIPPMA